MLERLRLDGKTAVVTGAGRGLGRAMAKALAQAGAELVCAARTSTQIAATVQEVRAAGGRAIAAAYEEAGARVARLTTLSASAVGQAVRRAAADMGSLQVLASASDRFLAKPVTDITPDDLTEVLTANCATQFYACQAGIDVLLRQGQGGNIVLVTHVLGERGLPNTSLYAAAHGALHNLIRALAQEMAPHRISINGVALGWMEWMHDRLDSTDEEANRALRFPIIKRAGMPADIGPIAVWLAGTGVGYVTGQIFPVDGGLTQHL